MAEYYLKFSLTIDVTPEEGEWLFAFVNGIGDIGAGGPISNAWHASLLKTCPDIVNDVGFNVDILAKHAHFYADEYGEPDHVAGVIQQFIRKFRPASFNVFCWSTYCSRMEPNTFGGGITLVTEDSIVHRNIQSMANRVVSRMRRYGRTENE